MNAAPKSYPNHDAPKHDENIEEIKPARKSNRRSIVRTIAIIFLVLIAIGAVAARKPLQFFLLGVDLPMPTGKYHVGRQTWDIICPNRPEIFTDDPNDQRIIRADVYYPVESTQASPTGQYIEPEIAPVVTGMPAFLAGNIRTNWLPNATPARTESPYPVLLFSPGLQSPPVFYTSLLEQMSSRGYIIVALWHPYTTSSTMFASGKVVEATFDASDAMFEGEESAQEIAKQRIAGVWAEDMRSALDEIAKRNQSGEFSAMFDLSRVGAFGHSFGGQNSAAAMTIDSRIRAGLNMDGTSVYAPILEKGVTGAFAMVYDTFDPPHEFLKKQGITEEQWWKNFTERNCPPALQKNASPFYVFQVKGLDHEGFSTDLPLLREYLPFAISEDMVGTLEGHRVLRIVSSLIGDFFDAQLSQKPSTLLNNPTEMYPELHTGIAGHPDPNLAAAQ